MSSQPQPTHAPARALITGAGGFVGRHLLEVLAERTDWQLYGNDLRPVDPVGPLAKARWVIGNLTDRQRAAQIIREVEPDYVFHLAAQSNVQLAFKDPEQTIVGNVVGELNVLETLREVSPRARVLVIGSSEEYGLVRPEQIPIDETAPLRPNNPYAVSKIAQEALATQYYLSYGLETVLVRPFNHIGPGQTEAFVTAAFARQVARIEAGQQEPVIDVGNLEADRDFTDVRDMVRAYLLAITRCEPGEVYNIGTGRAYGMRWILDTFIAMSKVSVEIRQDPARMRPADIPVLVCNPSKFASLTGWQPEIPIEQTLKDILDYWRMRVRS